MGSHAPYVEKLIRERVPLTTTKNIIVKVSRRFLANIAPTSLKQSGI